MDWLQVFVNLVLTGILLYVFQKVIDERSAKRLEKFKAELQSTSFERETKFSKLHEKRAEIIAEIYRKLLVVQTALIQLKMYIKSDGESDKNEKSRETFERIKEFGSYFEENSLYLPEHLCNSIATLYSGAIQTHLNLLLAHENKEFAQYDRVDNERYWESIEIASTVLTDNIAPLIKEIEGEFRNLLGS